MKRTIDKLNTEYKRTIIRCSSKNCLLNAKYSLMFNITQIYLCENCKNKLIEKLFHKDKSKQTTL